jgi:hypothetical protein
MAMTEKGVSTTKAPGQEQYKIFTRNARVGRKPKTFCQYDYRHTNGELFSCVKPTLEACREARDAWLEERRETK